MERQESCFAGDYIFSQQIQAVLDERKIPVYGYVESDQKKIDNENVFIRANSMDIRDETNCFIGNNVTTGENFLVSVSDYTSLQIGDDCMFSHEAAIYTNDRHGIFDVASEENINSTPEENASRKIVIGNHVWIGFRTMILYKTVIGNGSIIGAYSLVKNEFPNNCMAAGIPAKVIRHDVSWSRESGRDDIAACGMEYVNMTENI